MASIAGTNTAKFQDQSVAPVRVPFQEPPERETDPETIQTEAPEAERTLDFSPSLPRRLMEIVPEREGKPLPTTGAVTTPPATQLALARSHTQVEHRVYEAMRQLALVEGPNPRRIPMSLIMNNLETNARGMVDRALKGLAQKLSIRIESREAANRYGPLYRVFEEAEILAAREQAGIVIDPISKRIETAAPTRAKIRPSAPREKSHLQAALKD